MVAKLRVFVSVPVSKLYRSEPAEHVVCAHEHSGKFCPECGVAAASKTKTYTVDACTIASCKFPGGGPFGRWLHDQSTEAFGKQDVLGSRRTADDVGEILIGLDFRNMLNATDLLAAVDALRADLPELALKRGDVLVQSILAKE